jgi:hypothetical protein
LTTAIKQFTVLLITVGQIREPTMRKCIKLCDKKPNTGINTQEDEADATCSTHGSDKNIKCWS